MTLVLPNFIFVICSNLVILFDILLHIDILNN
jgi:hypothetical protein